MPNTRKSTWHIVVGDAGSMFIVVIIEVENAFKVTRKSILNFLKNMEIQKK